MSFYLERERTIWFCHITIWHTSGRLYHDLNFSGSLSSDVRWDCFSSLCFSFCSVAWETPSNQYNHHLLIQLLQEREAKRTVYFSWAFCIQPHVSVISLPSLRCPICQFTDKAQMFLTCLFWCQQLCFICSQIPCGVKGASDSPNGQILEMLKSHRQQILKGNTWGTSSTCY